MQGGKSLEEIAALFGDDVVIRDSDTIDLDVKTNAKYVEFEAGSQKEKV